MIFSIYEHNKDRILNALIDLNEETKILQNVDLDDLATQLIEHDFYLIHDNEMNKIISKNGANSKW